MTQKQIDSQKRLRELLKGLKREIFVELDKRIREVEESLGDQVSEQVNEQVSEHVEGEVKKKIGKLRSANKKFKAEFKEFQDNLVLRYKLPYAVMVVVGIMLFWYGALSIIKVVPVLNNGVVALVGGILLLVVTGAIYKKLVG